MRSYVFEQRLFSSVRVEIMHEFCNQPIPLFALELDLRGIGALSTMEDAEAKWVSVAHLDLHDVVPLNACHTTFSCFPVFRKR